MINVDPSQAFQTMDGFGASITDSSASLLYRLSADQRDQVMKSVFSPTDGIGMSFLRQPVGPSDFVNGPFYTYDDAPNGQTDYEMSHFSVAHDQAQILPLLRRALQLNPNLKVMASAWGQPVWMKDNNSLVGGHLKADSATVRAYALYLLKFVQAYQAAGVPIYALTVQNEPQNRSPLGYPGTDMPVADEAAVINNLGPMLRDAGLGAVKIISYDHNWAEHPNDIAAAQRLGEDPEPNYASDILRTSAAQWIAGTAYHCYNGDAAAQTSLHNAFPHKDIWFTECSGFHASGDQFPKYFADTLKWHAQNVVMATIQNWGKSVIDWNLALDPQGNPHNNGCGDSSGWCTGVVTIDGSNVTRNAEYYLIGHLSRFVQPGAVRIGSNNAGDLHNVAFRNPDGTVALVVDNVGGGTQTFGVSYNGQFISYTIPPGGLATLTWGAGGNGGGGNGGIDPTRWYQVINQNSGKCVDAMNRGAADGTVVQQWSCGSAQSNQQWQFRAGTGGFYTVVGRHAQGLVWDVTGGSGATDDGAKIQLWSNAQGANQQWQPVSSGDGYVRFVARNSGKCLDVTDVSSADGARLQQWSCTGGPAQSFRLVQQS
jgi:glucosylceramidase